jgi:hypothetical protein
MGWYDSHLHVFRIGEDEFGLPDQWQETGGWADDEVLDSRRVLLSTIASHGVKRFQYVYDMGDGWTHSINFQKPVAEEAGAKYPRCVAGERACPPEDCGGPWGYADLVKAIEDPKHKRHGELLEWLGREFNPEAFDLKETNKALR